MATECSPTTSPSPSRRSSALARRELALALALTLGAQAAGAVETEAAPPAQAAGTVETEAAAQATAQPRTENEIRRGLVGERGTFQHYATALWLGKGLRLNNPYRLSTPLGDSYESLSATATYVGLMVAASFGRPAGWEHGGSLQLDYALDGVRQEVLTPSYVVSHVLDARFRAYGRFGLPIVLEPDANLGAELGAGGVFQLWAGIGVTAELIGSLFYGAATLERSRTTVPVVSLQLGARADYEVLP